MVIVQSASESRGNVENIRTKDLKPYQANREGRYIAAYFPINSGSPFTFVIGDGKEHQFKKEKYLNKPLEQNSTYVMFLRYFEEVNNSIKPYSCTFKHLDKNINVHEKFFIKNSYYSTGWSREIKTLVKPPGSFRINFHDLYSLI